MEQVYKRDFIYVRRGEDVQRIATDPETITKWQVQGYSQCPPPEEEK